MISQGIEPTTFLLVAQCLNQLRHRAWIYLRFALFRGKFASIADNINLIV